LTVVRTLAELRALVAELQPAVPAGGTGPLPPLPVAGSWTGARDARRTTLALVPTMGYLHEGHLSLVDHARARADVVVLSIFVNPLQFGPGEDIERYPRDLDRDVALAAGRGVDMIFAPDAAELYPHGEPAVRIAPGPMADGLCGRYRPGHFAGVLTVVAKLFHMVRPDLAVFGAKDYQQAVLIRRMTADLNFPIEIDVAPTVRGPDGLALSSRNEYLSPAERASATALYRGLTRALEAYRMGVRDAGRLCAVVDETIRGAAGTSVQYVELVAPDTLAPLREAESGAVIAAAAFFGATRLIDNIVLS
jgi:pantoate--beta-alanine ligase